MAKTLEDTLLEQELTCPVCLEIYQEPHLLPCGHNFCLKCLQRLEDNANRGRLHCPECRESHRCATQWQKNFKLASITAGFQQRSFASRPSQSRSGPSYRTTDIYCDYCGPEITGDTAKRSATAVKTCLKCEVSMCSKHVQHHLELPALQNHPLVEPLSDMRKRKCTDHDETFRYYCMEECKFLCSVCTLEGGPSGHAIKTLKNTMQDLQASLCKQLQKVNRKIRKVEKNMQEQNELQQQNKAFLEGVDKQVDTFRGVLMSKMDGLLTSLGECLRAYGEENSLSIQQHLMQIEEDRSRLEVLHTGIEHLLQKNDPFQFIKEYMACAESYRGILKKPLHQPCLSRALRMDREVIGNRLEDEMENFMTYLREHVTTFIITVCSSDEEDEEMEEDELEEEEDDEEEEDEEEEDEAEDEDEEEEEEDDSDDVDSITEGDEMNED